MCKVDKIKYIWRCNNGLIQNETIYTVLCSKDGFIFVQVFEKISLRIHSGILNLEDSGGLTATTFNAISKVNRERVNRS